jgi:peptide deformylase
MRIILEQENPLLREKAEVVADSEFSSAGLNELAFEMIAIMKAKGAVGVAAPQIGISKRVIVFGTAYTQSRKIEDPIPDTILINPSIKILSEEIQIGYEGCLNCGDLRGEVPRAMELEYSGFDLNGDPVCKRVYGLEARIVQHEVDHLDGILFFDRIADKTNLTTAEALLNKV